MKFPGYWVSVTPDKVVLVRTVFDETDLDPATDWKQAWQNQEKEARHKGYVDLNAALVFAVQALAMAESRSLSQSECELVMQFDPVWTEDRCEISSLSCLLNSGGRSART